MVAPAAGSVVLVPFPFSDLSHAKLRPDVVLADASRGDWILSQITSKPYAEADAVLIQDIDFTQGTLQLNSFARPGKLFTAHESLLVAEAGKLKAEAFTRVIHSVIQLLQPKP